MTDAVIPFDNSYARLPDRFHVRQAPVPVPAPALFALNRPLAAELELDADWLASPPGLAMLSGNAVPDGAEPLAMAYAGHQFGGWNPQLGDGRALLLGEVRATTGRRDIQLKGSGRTPFSRMGDGRAWLGPVIREYIVSEAMHALGVPTTRALAAVTTGEEIYREAALPGAILTRVAASHIRVGTFQFFAARSDVEAIGLLTDHVIARHYPEAGTAEVPALALLEQVVAVQADLIARWMGLGFIHGVMNTDNMTVSGETIDYGPCAFMDRYHPDKVFSSIDQFGRYAYANQPRIAHWNLAQLASCLLPLIDADQDRAVNRATDAIETFPALYEAAWARVFAAKIGTDDPALATDLMSRMAKAGADFTLTFRALAGLTETGTFDQTVAADPEPLDAWLPLWRPHLAPGAAKGLVRANPAIIPRNHRIEEAIAAAVAGDRAPFDRLAAALATPFADHPDLAMPPEPKEEVTQTFCGT